MDLPEMQQEEKEEMTTADHSACFAWILIFALLALLGCLMLMAAGRRD